MKRGDIISVVGLGKPRSLFVVLSSSSENTKIFSVHKQKTYEYPTDFVQKKIDTRFYQLISAEKQKDT